MARFEDRPPRTQPTRGMPPLWRLAPATFALAVLCGLLFVATLMRPELVARGAMVPDAIWSGEVWRLVTSIFLHGGFVHVAFNVAWFVNLGGAIEARLGAPALLGLTLITGLAGGAGEMLAAGLDYSGAVGLSGAVYGLFFFGFLALRPLGGPFARLFSKQNAWLLGGWGVLAFVLTWLELLRIGNFAHAAGAASGALLGLVVAVRGPRRALLGAATLVLLVGMGLAAWRPVWSPRWQLWRAVSHLNSGRPGAAQPYLRQLAEANPGDPQLRALYALSLAAGGDMEEARAVWSRLTEADLARVPPQQRLLFQELVEAP